MKAGQRPAFTLWGFDVIQTQTGGPHKLSWTRGAKRTFGLGETTSLAKTLMGLVTRIAAKVTAYTYGLYVNRLLGRPQGRIKELWA